MSGRSRTGRHLRAEGAVPDVVRRPPRDGIDRGASTRWSPSPAERLALLPLSLLSRLASGQRTPAAERLGEAI